MKYDPEYLNEVKGRILHTLSVYPKLSPSMLHIGIGSQISSAAWRTVLELLKQSDIVDEDHLVVLTPTKRYQTHVIISLTAKASEVDCAIRFRDDRLELCTEPKPASDSPNISNGAGS